MAKQRRWTEEDLKHVTKPGGSGCVLLSDDKPHPDAKPKGKGRYGNVNKIEEDGIRFDSKREYLRYKDLKLMEKAGEIRFLEVHPKFPITIGGVAIMVSSNQHNLWDRHLTYVADFKYSIWEKPWWHVVVEDVKMQSGHRTGIYKLKRALMRAMGYDILEY